MRCDLFQAGHDGELILCYVVPGHRTLLNSIPLVTSLQRYHRINWNSNNNHFNQRTKTTYSKRFLNFEMGRKRHLQNCKLARKKCRQPPPPHKEHEQPSQLLLYHHFLTATAINFKKAISGCAPMITLEN